MLSALISFLGGSAFRVIWGEVSYFQKKQDHGFEIERMKLRGDLEEVQHARNFAAIHLQADMGVKAIEAQRDVLHGGAHGVAG